MASSTLLSTLILFCFILASLTSAESQVVDDASLSLQIAATDHGLKWPSATSLFDGDLDEDIENEGDAARRALFWRRVKYYKGDAARRALFWRRVKYYISYGALSADRVPCPPRSGRSYYTHNCHLARGPAHPYSRGCSTITRCSR